MKTWLKVGLAITGLCAAAIVAYGFVDSQNRKADSEAFDLAYDSIKQLAQASNDFPSRIDPMLFTSPDYKSIVVDCADWGQILANTTFDPGRDKSRLIVNRWDPIAARQAGNGGYLLLVAFETADKSFGVVACFVNKSDQISGARMWASEITPR